MDTNWLLAGGIAGAAGLVGGFWGSIKGFFSRLGTYVVYSSRVGQGEVTQAIGTYCFNNFKKSPYGKRNYSGHEEFVRPVGRNQVIGYEKIGSQYVVFWKGWRPIWVKMDTDGKGDGGYGGAEIKFIRGTFDMDELLLEAIDYFNQITRSDEIDRYRVKYIFGNYRNNYRRGGGDEAAGNSPVAADKTESDSLHEYRLLRWKHDELGSRRAEGSAIDALVLSYDMEQAVAEARFWKRSEKWYRDKGIPWRRGWLLYGRPGTGKTSLTRAIAEDMNMPIYVYDLASLSNEEFRREWNKMLRKVPCIALIEDIDSVFDGRKNVVGELGGGLTFDCLLNCIDGVERSDGMFLVITTNNIDKIDPAIGNNGEGIGSRPGRIDRAVKLTEPDRDGLMVMCQRILKEHPELWEQVVDEGDNNKDTGAQFQERCARRALEAYWDKSKPLEKLNELGSKVSTSV